MAAGEAGRHVVGFLDLFIHTFLEVQQQEYRKALYLKDYIAYGFHLRDKIQILGKSVENQFPNILA